MVALEKAEIVTAMPVTYINLLATSVVGISGTITPVTGGYLEKAHFSFPLS